MQVFLLTMFWYLERPWLVWSLPNICLYIAPHNAYTYLATYSTCFKLSCGQCVILKWYLRQIIGSRTMDRQLEFKIKRFADQFPLWSRDERLQDRLLVLAADSITTWQHHAVVKWSDPGPWSRPWLLTGLHQHYCSLLILETVPTLSPQPHLRYVE